jgi:hypothetical protein
MRTSHTCAGKVLGGMLFLALVGGLVVPAWGQNDERPPVVTVSYDGVPPGFPLEDNAGLSVRPNLTLPIYFHIMNPAPKAKNLKATLSIVRKDRPPLEFATAVVSVPSGETQIIGPWKVAAAFSPPAPAPAPAPAPGTTPPAAAPTPAPAFAELQAPGFGFRLQVSEVSNKPDEKVKSWDVRIPVTIEVPSEYIDVTEMQYTDNNKLTVRLVSKKSDRFRGGPCKIQLSFLQPSSTAPPIKEGVLKQVITAPEQKAVLLAEKLKLERDARFHLSIDDYERGYIYALDQVGNNPRRLGTTDKALRLEVQKNSKASDKLRVSLQTDNVTSKENATIHVKLLRDGDIITERILVGPRDDHVRLLPPEQDGAIPIKTLSSDWVMDLDVGDVLGRYEIEAIMYYKAGEETKTVNTIPPRRLVTLDGTAPDDVAFVSPDPKKLTKWGRARPLEVKATAGDGLSGIAEVSFFVGKPTKDHKPPPNAVLVKGSRKDPKTSVWTPDEPLIAADVKGKVDLGVIVMNQVGLSSSATTVVEVVAEAPEDVKFLSPDPKKPLKVAPGKPPEDKPAAGAAPAGVAEAFFVPDPKKTDKGSSGKALEIKATAGEGLSGIKEVFFFVGKPTTDHKPPPTASPVKGSLKDAKEGVWAPVEPVIPPDARGKIDLGVVFVSKAGVSSSAKTVVEVIDTLKGKATLTVTVKADGRPQNGLKVELRDDKGVVKLVGKTAAVRNKDGVEESGKILFKDLAPGAYKVSAVQPADQTKGETLVTMAGEDRDVDISLFR